MLSWLAFGFLFASWESEDYPLPEEAGYAGEAMGAPDVGAEVRVSAMVVPLG